MAVDEAVPIFACSASRSATPLHELFKMRFAHLRSHPMRQLEARVMP